MSSNGEPVKRIFHLLAPFLLFLIIYAIYLSNNDNIQPSDAIWTPHVAASLLYSGNSDLNEYLPIIEESVYTYATVWRNDKIYSAFPLGTPMLVAPLLLVSNIALTTFGYEDIYSHLQTTSLTSDLSLNLQLIYASFFVALTAALIFVIARRKLSWPYAALLAITFAFATSAYSTASRALWQHGPSMLMLTITIYFFAHAEEDSRWVRFAGIPLALSYVVRPTNSVAVVVFTLLVLIHYRSQIWYYLLGAGLIAIPFFVYNLVTFENIFSPYYLPNRVGQSAYLWQALIGNWISPARGLLIFTPIVFFAGVGVLIMIKRRTAQALDIALILIILLHWLLISSFDHWWAGFSYGPRFYTDMMPLFVLLMIPVFQTVAAPDMKVGLRLLLAAAFTGTLLLSIFIHHRGATKPATHVWNYMPISIDREPARLWDWSDLQFLRGLIRDQLFVRPTRISLPPPSAAVSEEIVTLSLFNPDDRPVVWEIQLPLRTKLWGANDNYTQTSDEYGNPLFVRNRQASPFSQTDIKVRIQYPEERSGWRSLGAVRVRVRDDTGQARNGTMQIVPIGLGSSSEGVHPTLFDMLPADISVNRSGRSNDLFAAYGYGWHSLETAEPRRWRWALSPAYLYVYSDKAQDVTVNIKLAALFAQTAPGEEGQITASVNGTITPPQRLTLEQSMLFEAPLQAGWNQLVLQSSAANLRPSDIDPQSDDGRLLNFAIESIEISSNEN